MANRDFICRQYSFFLYECAQLSLLLAPQGGSANAGLSLGPGWEEEDASGEKDMSARRQKKALFAIDLGARLSSSQAKIPNSRNLETKWAPSWHDCWAADRLSARVGAVAQQPLSWALTLSQIYEFGERMMSSRARYELTTSRSMFAPHYFHTSSRPLWAPLALKCESGVKSHNIFRFDTNNYPFS